MRGWTGYNSAEFADGTTIDSHKVADLLHELVQARGMMSRLVYADHDSSEWNEAMDTIGYYTEEQAEA